MPENPNVEAPTVAPAPPAPPAPPAIGPTMAFEEQARSDAKRFKIVAIVAAVLFAPQVISHFALPFFVVPTFKSMFDSLGGTLPPVTAFVVAAGPWLGVALVAIDALVFWGFYRLARKYWIGLLFAPMFAVGAFSGIIAIALYLPMFEVVNLVR